MQRLARVFFQMRTHQAHGFVHSFLAHFQKERHLAALHHRNFKLADLVALGQVGVEIIFPRKDAALGDVRAQCQTELNRAFNRAFVHHRQGAGQGQVHRTSLGVGFGAKSGGSAAENFAVRGQLRVGFKADDDFVAVNQWGVHAAPPGVCKWCCVCS